MIITMVLVLFLSEARVGKVFITILAVMIPAIAYFIPSWEPFWIRLLPTYYIIQGFRESIVRGGDWAFVLLSSAGFPGGRYPVVHVGNAPA